MDKKKRSLIIFALIFIFLLPINLAANLVKYDDDWTYSYSSITDGVAWGSYNLDTYALGYASEADCLCWDWCDDGSDDDVGYSDWDSCWCESTSKLNACKSKLT